MVFETNTEPPSMFNYNRLGDGSICEKQLYYEKPSRKKFEPSLRSGLMRIITRVRFWQGSFPNDTLERSVMCAV